jgi:hypothetical protein
MFAHNNPSPRKLIEEGLIEAVQMQSDNAATALLSIAVSMKRIADFITGEGATEAAGKLAETFFMKPINCYGEGIGEAIQGQIVRGNMGIERT